MIAVPTQAIELAKRFEGFHQLKKGDPRRAHPPCFPGRLLDHRVRPAV